MSKTKQLLDDMFEAHYESIFLYQEFLDKQERESEQDR
jgi:hypothetical protein